MRIFWEQTGVLLPIYRLAGQGLSDDETAGRLNVAQSKVQSCIAWLLHFLKLTTRNELVQYTSSIPMAWGSARQLKIVAKPI